jgi:hypothetical protein
MSDQTEVVDTVQDFEVTSTTYAERDEAYEAWVDDCARAAEAEAQADADLAAMHAAAEADGVDIDFGPLDRAAWEETMSRFPENSGLTPVIYRAKLGDDDFWFAELRRPGKNGAPYQVSHCLFWPTQKEAWAACVSRALTMVWLAENGARETAEKFFQR